MTPRDENSAVPALVLVGILVALSGGAGAAVIWGKTRGLRNNNPGNIRRGELWQGMAPEQSDPAFITFTAPEYGIRAVVKILTRYRSLGYVTPRAIVTRWAPPNENPTESYVRAVAGELGVSADATIAPDKLPALVAAIIRHENGIQPYPAELIARGIALA